MTREEAVERFNGIINAMSISIAQSKFYPSKAELNELCDIAIEALSADAVEVVLCKDCIYYHPSFCEIWSKYGTVQTRELGYCYMGERREDGEEE